MQISLIKSDVQLLEVFPLVKELIPDLEMEIFLTSANTLLLNDYLFFRLDVNNRPISFARAYQSHNLSGVKFLWIYTLVTTEDQRKKGYGRQLIKHIEQYAKEGGCDEVRLHSSHGRKIAHIFWEKLGYKDTARVYNKRIT